MDESWEACTGYSLAYEGRLRNPVVQNRCGIDRAFVQPRVTQSLALAASYRLLGFSLASGRVASVVAGLAAVLGVFYLMRTWLPHGAAGLVALLGAVETQFFMASRTVRPEVYLVCASVWMLALLARGTVRVSLGRCFAAGVVGAVGCYTHPNMAIVVVVGLVLIFWQIGPRGRAVVAAACFALGGIVGVLPFFAYVAYAHVHHDVSFIEQLGSWYTGEHATSASETAARELRRWLGYFRPVQRAPWVLLVGLSVVAGVVRRHPVQVLALVMTAGHLLLMPLLIRHGSPHYLVILSPWWAALIVVWAVQLRDPAVEPIVGLLSRRVRRALAVGVLAISFGVQLAGNAYLLHVYRNADYDAVCHRIAESVPPGSRVYGNLIFWTGLHQYPYLSDINEGDLPLELVESTLRSRFSSFAPQYVIRESDGCWIRGGLGPRPTGMERRLTAPPPGLHRFERRLADELADRRGVRLDRFITRDFGAIEVYRIRP